ncbi:MAG: ATP-binding protein [Candidatus Acidiferrum sp.]
MKSAAHRKAKQPVSLEDEYCAALREYATAGGEPALRRAYELGRQAFAERKSLVDLASLHHQAVLALIRNAQDEKPPVELLQASAEFLAECLSPYEMSQRGFQDAVKALRQLNETLEEEIKRIAYTVHDEAGQLLVAVHLALAELARELPETQQTKVAQIGELLNQVEKQLRRYSHELRPTILDDLGWIPAIRFLAEGVSTRAGLPIHIEATSFGRLPGAVETALYRVVQEAITNAVKHANAKNLWIRASRERLMLRCSIRDDGRGFDSTQAQAAIHRKGLGLVAMQERVSAIGGTLSIHSSIGKGTELSIQVALGDEHVNQNRAGG